MKNKKLNEGQTKVEIGLGDQGTLNFTLRLPLTDALKQVLLERAALDIYGALNPEFKEKYEKAYFGKLRRSNEKRAVFEFLRLWHHRNRVARHAGETIGNRELVTLLSPLIDALNKLDVMFFRILAEAVRILEQRAYSNKNHEPSTLDKFLLEYAMLNYWKPTHTTRELNEQFVSKFRKIEDNKLRDRCRKLGVPLNDGRGRPKKSHPGKKINGLI